MARIVGRIETVVRGQKTGWDEVHLDTGELVYLRPSDVDDIESQFGSTAPNVVFEIEMAPRSLAVASCTPVAVQRAGGDPDALEQELAEATGNWTVAVLTRTYDADEDGAEDQKDEAMVLVEEHGYSQSLQRIGNRLTVTYRKPDADDGSVAGPERDEDGPFCTECGAWLFFPPRRNGLWLCNICGVETPGTFEFALSDDAAAQATSTPQPTEGNGTERDRQTADDIDTNPRCTKCGEPRTTEPRRNGRWRCVACGADTDWMPRPAPDPEVLVRTYRGGQKAEALAELQDDASELARLGYALTAQSPVEGQRTPAAKFCILVGGLLMVAGVLITPVIPVPFGIVVLPVIGVVFLVIGVASGKTDGALTVTYSKAATAGRAPASAAIRGSTGGASALSDRLAQLIEARDKGLITQEEFDAMRADILRGGV